jgi:hypothetical protein
MSGSESPKLALSRDLRAVAVPWITVRALLAVAFITALAIADRLVPGLRPTQLTEGLVAWDGTWYRDIAAHGYAALPEEGLRFFPLFPMLGRVLGFVTFGRVDVALVLIANICSLGFAVGVRRLVLLERNDPKLADRAVWMTALFPGAFVLAFGYAEALWLLAAVIVFWGIRSRSWWWAAAAGFVAGLSRPLGVVLAVPAALELARHWGTATRQERLRAGFAVVAPVLGSLSYLLWVGRSFGNMWLPFTVQSDLRGETVDPISRLWEGLSQMVGPERLGDGLHIPFAIAFLALLVVTFRRWPVSYGVFSALVLIAAIGSENLNSLERYGLNAFPLAMSLAFVCRNPRFDTAVRSVLSGGVVALACMAWLGAYVP